jgi:glycosyltransferase involved in cell wall biosynthesis
MNIPEISVIVPVYNVERYLCKCLDSILNQTFTNFELLLIDDGSLDASGQICDEYALKDVRIRVFHKENGGVSSARNLGLDNAKGKWIAFIDSDDWVDSTYLEHLLEGDEDVELRVMGIIKQKRSKKWTKEVAHEELFLMDDFWRFYKLYMTYSIFLGPYVKLFLLAVINKINIRFNPSLSYGEDCIFNLQYLSQIKSISIKNYAEYYYRNTESSLCKNILPDKYEKFIKIYKKVTLPLLRDKRINDIINNYLKTLYLDLYIECIKYLYVHQNLKPRERREYLSQIFVKLNSYGLSRFHTVSITKRKMGLCIICLYHVPIVVADIILLLLLWVRRNIS